MLILANDRFGLGLELERRLIVEADAALKSGSRRRLLTTKLDSAAALVKVSLAVRRSHSTTAVVVSDGPRKFGDAFPTSVGDGF